MTHSFAFEHQGCQYGVVGKYAAEFAIAVRLSKAEARGDAQSTVKLLSTITAASETELVSKLEASFSGLKNFAECVC